MANGDGSDYSLSAILDKQPQSIATAIVAVLNIFVITGIVDMSAEAVGACNVALVAVLGLFVRSKSVAVGDVKEKVETAKATAVAQTTADISTYLSTVAAPNPPQDVPPPPAPGVKPPGGG